MQKRKLLFTTCLAGLMALGVASPGAADPFSENLLRQGTEILERGEPQRAARLLRLACFGLLDEPPVLASCLVPLALAQAAMEDHEAFLATFERLLEIEQRFRAYSEAGLSTKQRDQLEEQLEDLVPIASLERSPAFRHVAQRKQAAGVDGATADDAESERGGAEVDEVDSSQEQH